MTSVTPSGSGMMRPLAGWTVIGIDARRGLAHDSKCLSVCLTSIRVAPMSAPNASMAGRPRSSFSARTSSSSFSFSMASMASS